MNLEAFGNVRVQVLAMVLHNVAAQATLSRADIAARFSPGSIWVEVATVINCMFGAEN